MKHKLLYFLLGCIALPVFAATIPEMRQTTTLRSNDMFMVVTNTLQGGSRAIMAYYLLQGLQGLPNWPASAGGTNQSSVAASTNVTVVTNVVGGVTIYTVSVVAYGITNGLATTNYAQSLTNGFVQVDVTNGLATISYVQSLTNGLVTQSITNGLATVAYMQEAIASFVTASVTNGLATLDWSMTMSNALYGLINEGGATTEYVDNQIATRQPTNAFLTAWAGFPTNVFASHEALLTVSNFLYGLTDAASNALYTVKVDATVTNGLATITYVQSITNGLATISYVESLTNGFVTITVTNGLATISYVQSITNGLATIDYAQSLTNGFVTQAITNGLATISYAEGLTNGFVGISVTNGLATITYAQSLTNGFVTTSVTNGLATLDWAMTMSNVVRSASQPASANLTEWSGWGTNVLAGVMPWGNIDPSYYQPAAAYLDDWSLYPTNLWATITLANGGFQQNSNRIDALETGKQPASSVLSNLVNTLSVTNLQAGWGMALRTNAGIITMERTNHTATLATNATWAALDFTGAYQRFYCSTLMVTNLVLSPTNGVPGRSIQLLLVAANGNYDLTITNASATVVHWAFNNSTNGSTSVTVTNGMRLDVDIRADDDGSYNAVFGYAR